mgnify:FL=1|jgi:hypothetical protein
MFRRKYFTYILGDTDKIEKYVKSLIYSVLCTTYWSRVTIFAVLLLIGFNIAKL